MALLFVIEVSCISKRLYLDLEKDDFSSSFRLKMNGYYYAEKNYRQEENTFFLQPVLFYKDGTFKRMLGHRIDSNQNTVNIRHKIFTDRITKLNPKHFNGTITGWGHYKLKNDTLIMRYFEFANDNIGQVIYEAKGIILDDTTYVTKYLKCYEENWEGKILKPDTFKFAQFHYKPDSTNPTFEF
jgi:hypothetical protein